MFQLCAYFGNLYRTALLNFLNGNMDAIPGAWRYAHQTASDNSGLVLEYVDHH